MPLRLYLDQPFLAEASLTLPPGPSRHVQVLRLQPGDEVVLFNGQGGEWHAEVLKMGRNEVDVKLLSHDAVDRELPMPVTVALGMPANERMDMLVEKATELGVAAIQPLLTERSVLRLSGERAERRREHWQGVAVAASEQSGRTRVPVVAPIRSLSEWVRALPANGSDRRLLLSPRAARPLVVEAPRPTLFLSGPEGGLGEAEEALARSAGFDAVTLGPRVLRADTAPLAVLALLGLSPA
jgi:16S rRNA (uracil1498-N3)-methyltransferase